MPPDFKHCAFVVCPDIRRREKSFLPTNMRTNKKEILLINRNTLNQQKVEEQDFQDPNKLIDIEGTLEILDNKKIRHTFSQVPSFPSIQITPFPSPQQLCKIKTRTSMNYILMKFKD